MTTAVVLHFGRPSLGEAQRVDTWVRLLTAAGMEVTCTTLVPERGPRRPSLGFSAVGSVLSGRAVPEALAWSTADVLRRLRREHPDVLVCQTARAYQPALLAGPWVTVVDFVDRLSASYGHRAAITHSRRAAVGYRLLEKVWERFERRPTPDGVRRVAAGWTDARDLDAEWLPVLASDEALSLPAAAAPTHDLVFFGTLDYLPNVEGLDRLARITRLMPDGRRPSVLVAGRNPAERVVALTRREGWTLQHEFGTVQGLAAVARLAVAPMTSTAGIQIKVLEAAAAGLAQVASPEAVAGFRPGIPIAIGRTDREFAEQVAYLLADDDARAAQAADARAEVVRTYAVPAWVDWAAALVG